MIAGLKPYPAMKDSGMGWLGEVPAHWEVQRADRRLTVVRQPVNPNEISDQQVVHYSIPNVQRIRRGTIESGSSIDSAKTLVDRTLLLVSKLNPRKGTIALAEPDRELTTLASSEFVAMEPEHCIGGFARYAYESEPVRLELSSRVDSATKSHQRCSPGDISKLPVPWPPFLEQTAIARFLDYTDRRIRRYIRAKQKLIALLEEHKQAIIRQVVTGRIDVRTGQPYPAYKPSGVPWLGNVPAHWEVVALRRRWRVIDCKHLTVPFVDGGIPLASVREAQNFELNFKTSNHTTPEWYEKLIEGGREPRPGDLIYCRNVSVGAAALVTTQDRFAMGQDVCLIRSSSENQRWLNYFLRSKVMSDQLALILVGSTFNRINVADIKALLIAVPPLSEQDQIAAVLDDEQSKIAVTIRDCHREQALLHEYRTRLIADVVTGKLDVREAAKALPEVDPLAADDELDEPIDADAEENNDGLEVVSEEVQA